MISEWKGMIFDDSQFFGDKLFGISEVFFFFRITKRKRTPPGSCSPRTADTVHIGFGDI